MKWTTKAVGGVEAEVGAGNVRSKVSLASKYATAIRAAAGLQLHRGLAWRGPIVLVLANR
jgi:hypothetical protein